MIFVSALCGLQGTAPADFLVDSLHKRVFDGELLIDDSSVVHVFSIQSSAAREQDCCDDHGIVY